MARARSNAARRGTDCDADSDGGGGGVLVRDESCEDGGADVVPSIDDDVATNESGNGASLHNARDHRIITHDRDHTHMTGGPMNSSNPSGVSRRLSSNVACTRDHHQNNTCNAMRTNASINAAGARSIRNAPLDRPPLLPALLVLRAPTSSCLTTMSRGNVDVDGCASAMLTSTLCSVVTSAGGVRSSTTAIARCRERESVCVCA
jgi:hypothetical protein